MKWSVCLMSVCGLVDVLLSQRPNLRVQIFDFFVLKLQAFYSINKQP